MLKELRRKAILVVGMHRSGTSAVAGALAHAGAALPADLMGASQFNQLGHFEPIAVANYNDDILAALGVDWHTPFPPDPKFDRAAALSPFMAHAREIIRHQYRGDDLIVLKEPRVSLLLDLWMEALETEGYSCKSVIMVRNPHDVAASLQVAHDIVPIHGLLTWATYMVSADLSTRGRSRVFCSYEALLKDAAGALAAIVRDLDLGLDLPIELVTDLAPKLVQTKLRHHAAEPRQMPPGLAPLNALADHYQALAAGLRNLADTPTAALCWLQTIRPLVMPLIEETRRDAYRLAGLP